MGLADKLFGGKKSSRHSSSENVPRTKGDVAESEELIRVYDEYGREVSITKREWRDKVLLGNLRKVRDNPDQLYGMLVGALTDGFAADIIPYAEHLRKTDSVPSRGATILGIVYMEVGRLDDAERALDAFLASHGEDGVVLTNLAKVYSRRGQDQRAETLLWHALEVDPNQENGLEWYVAIERDRGGDSAALSAFRRVAALPNSWRAELWLARDALQRHDLDVAEALYREALKNGGCPAPPDLLMQMSGDLGENGYLSEAVSLTEPQFDPSLHGLPVGNNLIKANMDLGRLDEAARILNMLYTQQRPDWREALHGWETELAKARIEANAAREPQTPSVSIMAIEGPLWTRDGSLFAELLPQKGPKATRIALFGSTAMVSQLSEQPRAQLTDAPGRLSRSAPLVLAEHIHLTTDALGVALIPWAQGQGFAVFGRPYGDRDLCTLVSGDENAPSVVVGIVIDATQGTWKLVLRVLRREDGVHLAEISLETAPEDSGKTVDQLAERLVSTLAEHVGVREIPVPSWYQRPHGLDGTDYLLRVEQQLAVASMSLEFLRGGSLSGEREIIDGTLELCLRQPANSTVRMVLSHTLRQMKKARPDILPEYRHKIELLQRDHHLRGEVAPLVAETISEALGD